MTSKIKELICNAVIDAGTTFSEDRKKIYSLAQDKETNKLANWVLKKTIENGQAAETLCRPLCDDTGIPHVLIDIGPNKTISYDLINLINEGIALGLRKLPGRPMAVVGDDYERIEQSFGISIDPSDVVTAPISIRQIDEELIRIHILLFGGGPAIRGKTHRVFHKHDTKVVINEIVDWATEGVKLLGCSPCTIGVGIGRSHYEATSLVLQALVDGKYDVQSDIEKEITDGVNESGIGPLGLGGNTSALATFLKVGPQRSSGIRVVSVIPCCSIEPRIATVTLK